ncbi:hypothetical protein HO173_003655 [Letharia columbiana]|uniref:Thioredoxin n=1 Tax=Letharia columbiana TaxID=112416 RepID=A0A8H6G0R2_9LECA|nr:uncharacterized protein HO173_003655 [Letharia columbiana]KAF6238375.1 hypothetical protein HO173_003655 [Letharia columbiana]
MDVELYVYDLSKGLARQMSGQLLGIQIAAVYHTALVFGGIEYFFGAGVQTSYPGRTHHGKPMEVIPMGATQLPLEVILEYLESLKAIYTMESYDLFLHNCNNFTNDFAMFLIGKGIPDHITSLPQTVLNTPFGQMLKPQLDNAMRGITQAPVPPNSVPRAATQPQSIPNGLSSRPQTGMSISQKKEEVPGVVYKPTRLKQLDELLASAQDSCAVVFFTSATCPPCKIVYPAYDELAAEAGNKAVLIKVDLTDAYEIGARYQVRATPTFMTFIKGEKESEWSGANEAQLRGNVRLLIQMAHPPHPHTLLRLPTLQRLHKSPVTYTKIPPIEKLIAKMGTAGSDTAVGALKGFVTTRQQSGAVDAPLPDLPAVSAFISKSFQTLQPESLFPIVDLFRLALVDPRVSGYYAEDASETVFRILNTVNRLDTSCPYQLRIVTLHMACNLFTSQLFPIKLFMEPSYSTPLFQLVTSSLLDNEHPPVRVAASSLAFNMAASNHQQRIQGKADFLPESSQVELVASLLEAMGRERESKDGMRGLLVAVGLLKYMTDKGGEVDDLCEAVGAKDIIAEAKGAFPDLRELAKEVEQVM